MDRKSNDRFLSVEIDCYFQTISNFLLLLKGTDFKQRKAEKQTFFKTEYLELYP